MPGALFILGEPIFNGLAISLIFGILVHGRARHDEAEGLPA